MTLKEIIQAIDALSPEEQREVEKHLAQRKSPPPEPTGYMMTDEEYHRRIAELIEQAEPVEIKAGTMDIDKLTAAVEKMREGFTQEQLNEIA
ncbi:MAG: hypothetical protein AAF787_18565, partial [Chloroflexota bacterium]